MGQVWDGSRLSTVQVLTQKHVQHAFLEGKNALDFATGNNAPQNALSRASHARGSRSLELGSGALGVGGSNVLGGLIYSVIKKTKDSVCVAALIITLHINYHCSLFFWF